ncbi:MAG: hypothetical protein QOJ23_3198, partial [Actinomycetota bacterium]|nr:hypothetical protein [Actinomycetota bacterium]
LRAPAVAHYQEVLAASGEVSRTSGAGLRNPGA